MFSPFRTEVLSPFRTALPGSFHGFASLSLRARCTTTVMTLMASRSRGTP
jgi:hypothetical protein